MLELKLSGDNIPLNSKHLCLELAPEAAPELKHLCLAPELIICGGCGGLSQRGMAKICFELAVEDVEAVEGF